MMHHYLLEEYYSSKDWNREAEYVILYDVIVLLLNLEKRCGYEFSYSDFEAAIADKSLYWQTKYLGCFNFLSIHKMLDSYAPQENLYGEYRYKAFRYGLKQMLPDEYQHRLLRNAPLKAFTFQMHVMITVMKFLVIHGSCLYVECVLIQDRLDEEKREYLICS